MYTYWKWVGSDTLIFPNNLEKYAEMGRIIITLNVYI